MCSEEQKENSEKLLQMLKVLRSKHCELVVNAAEGQVQCLLDLTTRISLATFTREQLQWSSEGRTIVKLGQGFSSFVLLTF